MDIAVLRGPAHVVEVANQRLRTAASTDPVGRPAREIFHDVLGQRILDLLDNAFLTGERLALHDLPVEWHRGHGLVTGHVNLVLEPLRDAEGRTVGVFMVLHDITDAVRDRAEVDLAAAERSTILSHIDLGVLVVDAGGRPVLVNDAAERAIGGALESTRPLLPQLAARWRLVDANGCPISPDRLPLTLALRGETVPPMAVAAEPREGGERRVVQVAAAPLVDATGRVRAAMATFGDRVLSAGHPALLELAERSMDALRRLREVAMNTGTAFDRASIGIIVANLVRGLIQVDAAAVFVASERTGTLRLLADDNLSTRPRIIDVPFGVGVSGVAHATARPVRVRDYAAWPHALPELVGVISSGMAVPLLDATRSIGAIAVHTIAERTFTDEEEWALTRIASEAVALVRPRANLSP